MIFKTGQWRIKSEPSPYSSLTGDILINESHVQIVFVYRGILVFSIPYWLICDVNGQFAARGLY